MVGLNRKRFSKFLKPNAAVNLDGPVADVVEHADVRRIECGDDARLALEQLALARGIFTSVADLARKIRRYIHRYNTASKPIRWAYRNPAHRIVSTSSSTVH